MAFNGSAIKALLDGAVAKGAVHGVAAVVVDRNGALFHHAVGEANERTLPGMRSKGTADWAGSYNSYFWIDRAKGIGGVLMTQLRPFFDMPVVEALMGFERAVYQQVSSVVPAA